RTRESARGTSAAVFRGMAVATRNSDVEHAYRAHSDLYWLTGFEEPEAVAVLASEGDKPFTLFVRPRDKEREIWTGRRAGTEGAGKTFGAGPALQIDKVETGAAQLGGAPRAPLRRPGRGRARVDPRLA